MQPRTVLRTIPIYFPHVSGPANQAKHITRGITSRGFRSPIFTTDHGARDSPLHEVMDGTTVTRFRESFGIMAYRHLVGAGRLRDQPADLIHAHNYRNQLTTLAWRIAKDRGIPLVIQPHGSLRMYRYILPPHLRFPYTVFDTLLGKRQVFAADAVVVATTQERDEAIRFGVQPEKIHVIPVGSDPDPIVRPDPPGSPVTILFVGRITPNRNVEQILDAVARARRTTKRGFALRIVGGAGQRSSLDRAAAYLNRMKQRAVKLKIDDITTFSGSLYGQDLTDAYRQADVFVYTSLYENFGQSILEAAAHGLAIIATPTGVANDLIHDGETGHLVAAGDAQTLSLRLQTLIEDPQRIREFGDRARDLVASGYRWDRIIQQYVDLYDSLIG